jgi:hypothetical protein
LLFLEASRLLLLLFIVREKATEAINGKQKQALLLGGSSLPFVEALAPACNVDLRV